MELSATGLNLVKLSEGFRAKMYLDIAGFPTIGYGHKLVHPENFTNGISEVDAESILKTDLEVAEQAVKRLVKVPLTQGQFDALVDFVFNLGAARLAQSTLLLDLNEQKYDLASGQILRWDHSGANEIAALKARRTSEFNLWHGLPA